MKLQILIALASIGLVASTTLAAKVDLSKSTLHWTGSKVVGSKHTGNVKIKAASVNYKKGLPTSANVVIDMTSITNDDVKDPKWNKKLVNHLKDDDFFGVDKHKTAQLSVSKIQKVSDKFYFLIGELTIKGKKQPIKLKAEVTKDSKKSQVITTNLEFDRTKFDVKYGSGTFFSGLGDKMISDDIQIKVDLHITK